jgi:hypothetical protein
MFNYVVIDKAHRGICDRFESKEEAQEAYPNTVEFEIEFYSDQEIAAIDAAFAEGFR